MSVMLTRSPSFQRKVRSVFSSWRVFALCFAMLLTPLAQAKDMKVAVLDFGGAMLQSDRAQKMADSIKKDLQKRESEIRKIEQEIKTLTEKAERDGPVMSDSDKYELSKKVRDRQDEARSLVEKFQKRQKEGRDDIVRALRPKLAKVVEEVVKKGGYDLVLERGGVVYVSEAYDITGDVVEALNKVLKK